MAYTATAAPIRESEPETEPAPAARRETTLEIPCGTIVAVTVCEIGEHRMTELRSDGQSIVARLVCGPRYRPAPLAQITQVGGDS